MLEEDILESTMNAQVIGSVEVISTSSDDEKFVGQSNKETDEPSSNALLDKKEFSEVEEREANGERSGFDRLASAGRRSEFSPVGDESSSTFEEENPEKNEQEVPVSAEVTSVSNETEMFEEQITKEVPDQHLDLPGDVINSQKINASNLPKAPSVQPCQSNLTKSKRRLRPASSVMLRNIDILELDDATEIPKHHGKRGEKEDGRKRTQGSMSLLRILKQNVHH